MTPTAAARASQSTQDLRDRLKDPSLLRDRCYIDGAWVGTPVLPVNNPATGAEIARVPQLSAADATAAVEAAERAFPAWAKLTAKQRSNILRKWYELIAANREDLALILTSEQGKPLAEALGEVDIGGAYIEFFAEEARRVYGETIPSQRPAARDQAADRRLRRDYAVEFPELHDHPQGVAGACRRLHCGAQARQ
jgi:succinate-semialdehyde dehydrogenase/glutarate-semialdehyde dehydrogenase